MTWAAFCCFTYDEKSVGAARRKNDAAGGEERCARTMASTGAPARASVCEITAASESEGDADEEAVEGDEGGEGDEDEKPEVNDAAPEWKVIPEFEAYEASTMGDVRNAKTKKGLTKYQTQIGYERLTVRQNGKTVSRDVHRLIALTFLENPEKKRTVNHKNKIRNDNRVANLEWATHSEQNTHSRVEKYTDEYSNTSFYPEPQPDEEWRDSPSLEGYAVSNYGAVKRIINGRIKCTTRDGRGYCSVNAKLIHRLVAEVFLPNYSNDLVVNHKDGNKSNNHVSNLECVSQSRNILHAYETNSMKKLRKYTVIQVDYLGNVVGSFESFMAAALQFGISHCAAISGAVSTKGVAYGYRWYRTYEEYEMDKPNIFGSIFKVFQNTEDGAQIAVYDDFREAEKKTGIPHGNINSAVNGFKDKLRGSGGYIWTTTRVPKTELLEALRAKKS